MCADDSGFTSGTHAFNLFTAGARKLSPSATRFSEAAKIGADIARLAGVTRVAWVLVAEGVAKGAVMTRRRGRQGTRLQRVMLGRVHFR